MPSVKNNDGKPHTLAAEITEMLWFFFASEMTDVEQSAKGDQTQG